VSVRTRFAVFAFKLVFKPLDFFNHRRKRKAATILYIIRRHDARGDRTYGIFIIRRQYRRYLGTGMRL